MDLLEQLVNLQGVSGNEHAVREFIVKEARKHVKDVSVDRMGNVVVHKKGKRPTILLLAHMDEVGLIVSSVRGGKVYINTIGGVDPAILLGARVMIQGKKPVLGVITMNEVLNDRFVPSKFKVGDLYVYTGLTDKELKSSGVAIGSYVEFSDTSRYTTLGSDSVIAGKALDDRIGCYILLELIRTAKTPNDVYFVFTVQEEIGLYGAKASVFNIQPDYALAIDVTGHNDEHSALVLGGGPTLTIKDAEMLGNKCLNEKIEEIAARQKIRMQLEVSEIGATDAASIFAAKGGIPSSILGVAVANLHTPNSIASRNDIESTIKLLQEFFTSPPDKCWA